ncbi:hypothetical protein HDV05_004113 [Chytridiales sp. JEL 0842]|nr:hypothetical protein HDV05_004113 [Chytridiales sp. JEL 0842]
MNLLASSIQDPTLLFIACLDTIFCYRTTAGVIASKPFKKLASVSTDEFVTRNGPESINAIRIGFLGSEEVLVSVGDYGSIHIFFIHEIELDRPPILLMNDNESTWGVAIHGPKRLLAVSANSHAITIFVLAHDKEIGASRKTLVGHQHNIPCIDFNSNGDFLASCSIDGSCRIWNVNTGECLYEIFSGDRQKWNWSVRFVPRGCVREVEQSTPSSNLQQLCPRLSAIELAKKFRTGSLDEAAKHNETDELATDFAEDEEGGDTEIPDQESTFAIPHEQERSSNVANEEYESLQPQVTYLAQQLIMNLEEAPVPVEENIIQGVDDDNESSEWSSMDSDDHHSPVFDATVAQTMDELEEDHEEDDEENSNLFGFDSGDEEDDDDDEEASDFSSVQSGGDVAFVNSQTRTTGACVGSTIGRKLTNDAPWTEFDELLLFTSDTDVHLVDIHSLKLLSTSQNLMKQVFHNTPYIRHFDRLSLVQVIPEFNAVLVGTQAGVVSLIRLIIVNDGEEAKKYQMVVEYDFAQREGQVLPLLGMGVCRSAACDPSLDVYRLVLLYYDGTSSSYELRRKSPIGSTYSLVL